MSPFLLRRLSDQSLGRRLAAGEAAAFDELYRRYAHRLAAYGGYLLGDQASGEDVAQVTLLKAYGALRDGRNPEHVRPWLYRIAHNASLDILGRRRELPSPDLPERAAPAQGLRRVLSSKPWRRFPRRSGRCTCCASYTASASTRPRASSRCRAHRSSRRCSRLATAWRSTSSSASG